MATYLDCVLSDIKIFFQILPFILIEIWNTKTVQMTRSHQTEFYLLCVPGCKGDDNDKLKIRPTLNAKQIELCPLRYTAVRILVKAI